MTTPFDDLLPTLPKKVALAARECWEACKDSKVGDTMSHIHHAMWLERLNEPVKNRIRYILRYKDSAEHVERLRRLRPFDTSKATPEWREALPAYDKARSDYNTARDAYEKARHTYDKVRAVKDKAWTALNEERNVYYKAIFLPEMLAVHTQVCGCPWDRNTNIFGN